MLSGTTSSHDTIFYPIRSGDNLSAIIKRYYGTVSQSQQNDIIARILADNPAIKNPHLIYPGQALVLDIPRQYCAAPGYLSQYPTIRANKNDIKPLQQQWQKATPQEKGLLSGLAPIMLGTGSASLMMLDQTFKTNTPLVTEIAENYVDLKSNKVTKGQYDYKRQKLLYKLKTKLGPTNLLLNGSKSPNEVLRITRTKGSLPTQAMAQQIKRMGTLSKVASRGGVILSVAGLGLACYEIANTNNTQEKNEILFESLGGLAGGLAYGAAATLAVVVIATPVGWIGALVIGVGGAMTGMASGYAAKYWYTTRSVKVDFTSITKVDHLCK